MKQETITVALDYALGSKKKLAGRGGVEWELHLLYLTVSDHTYNYATTELNCSDSSLKLTHGSGV